MAFRILTSYFCLLSCIFLYINTMTSRLLDQWVCSAAGISYLAMRCPGTSVPLLTFLFVPLSRYSVEQAILFIFSFMTAAAPLALFLPRLSALLHGSCNAGLTTPLTSRPNR
ncbi:hypothetical protein IWX49DRAFT_56737 [Phyllosticta citricarpa]|uniref:Uncharacterized protein n=1 Tax=Phyllosticta paracitricarpa TaxID=2016321 RepID=A0ABR1N6I6_9PEZI